MLLSGRDAMISAAECRKCATSYKAQSREAGISTKRATLLRNIAQSLSGLASQLDMLIENTEDSRIRREG
jgi:hypothetical protein